ncbi:MAG TPA: MATE family efflux transporter [Methylomirabilota bacterium]|jgi:MATE family multidrug resistance protein|nr:MATE family efflux transporter [Methylomirabilota bacterium]
MRSLEAPQRSSHSPHRRIWRLAGPIIFSNVTVPLLGAVDTAVVGHLPDPALIGGVAIGATIFTFTYWAFGFLRMGTTGFVAQAFGAGDESELKAVVLRALLLALGIGALIVALQWPILKLSLWLFGASTAVEAYAATYFAVRIWGAPAALINYAVLGWLLGVQNARLAFLTQLFMNGLNMALAVLFVMGFGWGIQGVAAATLIAEIAGAALGLWLLWGSVRRRGGGWPWARLNAPGRMAALLKVNLDILIRTLCLMFAFAYFTAKSAGMGDAVLAANAILQHLQAIMAYGLDGFAHAAEMLVGAAIGARDRAGLRAAVRTAAVWGFATAVLFAALYAVAGTVILGLFTEHEAVRAAARDFLPWAIASPFLSVWPFLLDGVFIGATRTAEMRNGMVIALALYLGAASLFIPAWGNHGLWAAFFLFMVARAATLGWWYPRVEAAAR